MISFLYGFSVEGVAQEKRDVNQEEERVSFRLSGFGKAEEGV